MTLPDQVSRHHSSMNLYLFYSNRTFEVRQGPQADPLRPSPSIDNCFLSSITLRKVYRNRHIFLWSYSPKKYLLSRGQRHNSPQNTRTQKISDEQDFSVKRCTLLDSITKKQVQRHLFQDVSFFGSRLSHRFKSTIARKAVFATKA
jgi:hypothetical protein